MPSAAFDQDAKAGRLPDVAWLFAPDGLSEHPSDFQHTGKPLVSAGMKWTAERVHAAATGPLSFHFDAPPRLAVPTVAPV